jgi:hypothetical protein
MVEATEKTMFGAWTLQQVDETGRRAWVSCRCGTVRQISLEALQSGASQSCGCLNLPETRQPLRRSSFADEISATEARGGKKRHFGGGVS